MFNHNILKINLTVRISIKWRVGYPKINLLETKSLADIEIKI